MILKVNFANRVDPDQTAHRSSLITVHTVCLYAKIGLKSLQEYSADDINRRHFHMHVFLAFSGLKRYRTVTKQENVKRSRISTPRRGDSNEYPQSMFF